MYRFQRDVGEKIQCDESARKKGIVVKVASPTELSVIAGEMKVSAKVGKNIRLYAMTNRFPDRYIVLNSYQLSLRKKTAVNLFNKNS